MTSSIIIEIEGDQDFLEGDESFLLDSLKEALVRSGGPIKNVKITSGSDLFWELIADGVAEWAPEVYDDMEQSAKDRAIEALLGEQDSILEDMNNHWLASFWDGDPPDHIVKKVREAIEEADRRATE